MSEQDNNALEEAPCAIPHSAVAKAVGEAADQESSQLPAKGKDGSGDTGQGLHFTIEGRHGLLSAEDWCAKYEDEKHMLG